MIIDYDVLLEQQVKFLNKVLMKDKLRLPLLVVSRAFRKVKREYQAHSRFSVPREEFEYLAELIDRIDRNYTYRLFNKLLHEIADVKFERKFHNDVKRIRVAIKQQKSEYLAIVCIIKNESRYIREWILYNKMMGVDHIYLFNNGSTDNIEAVLKEDMEDGYVTLFNYSGENAQLPLYRMTVKALKDKYRWVAYIDADEFVLPTEGTFKEFLQGKEMYPAIGINWVVFGTGGHKTRPEGLVTESYLLTFEDKDNLLNLRIKSIVNPAEVYDFASPHFCVLKNSKYAVDEDGQEITTKWMYVSGSGPAFTGENKRRDIRINHYWTKSEQDLLEKCARGYAAGSFSPDYENIMKRLDYPQKEDDFILKYVPEIQKLL